MYEWQNLAIPEVIEIFGYRIEPTPGGWMLVAVPLLVLLVGGVLVRFLVGKEDWDRSQRDSKNK